jgi:magnesium chelatase family protein
MFVKILSSAVCGIISKPVYIELDISSGMPVFTMIGSLSAQVRESQDRVRTALKNIGILLPPKRITISLSPGDIKKDGTGFDIPIAAALLTALDEIPPEPLENCMLIGELHLNGDIEGVPGILPSVIAAKEAGAAACIVPYENAAEASSFNDMKIIALKHIRELIEYCRDPHSGKFVYKNNESSSAPQKYPDFSDIRGQNAVKRAALIAASGFHNILMCGPPGSGKSMAARRIPSILPDMTKQEQLEVSRIYSVAGLLDEKTPVITRRPFRAPHHTLSPQALCGGGRIPSPGEITLAHKGVLFIDELPEMSGRTLENLRGPMEDHFITISRTTGSFTFPSHFLFAAAMNPCPCGHYPDLNKCTCSAREIHAYMSKISRPILDRIDIRVNVPPASFEDLCGDGSSIGCSADMKAAAEKAFNIQKDRYSSCGLLFNSELGPGDIKKYCALTAEAGRLLGSAFLKLDLSARAYHRILKLARTIADLDGSALITEAHISEAFVFRNL